MRAKRLLFVGDGGSPDALAAQLGGDIAIVRNLRSIPVSQSAVQRQLIYLKIALETAWHSRRYDKIFFWQQYIAIYYAIFARLLFARTPFMVYYIIAKAGRGLNGKVKTWLFMQMLRSRANVTTYFMTSADYIYRRVQGTPLGAKCRIQNGLDVNTSFISEIATPGVVGGYVFSGGTNNREYADIAALARADRALPIRVACRPEDVRHLAMPDNVAIVTDAYGPAFDRLVAEARLVVIPVRDPDVMSGQLVCIQALAAGKVVLFRRNNFLRDWLGDLDQCAFIRQYRDAADLCAQAAALTDGELAAFGSCARRYYETAIQGTLLYGAFAKDVRATPWAPA